MAERLSFGAFGNAADLLSGAGKLLGVVGGVLAGALQFYEGYEAREDGDVVFGVGSMLLGVSFGKHALGGEKFPNLHAQTLAYDALLKEE
ncbi:MAG: hypothetical protein P8014_19975 [Acidihalobacter sp.]|uniref:hypothetical protein n=1 Tax=Acidihalobacter sp. TaxID=1872108 RepID=UPI00307FCCE5